MKSIILKLSILAILLLISLLSLLRICNAQGKENGQYLVINYVTTALSPLVVDMLNHQIKDGDERNKVISKISEQKYYFTLIYDTQDNSALYYLDSTNLVSGVNSGGNYEIVVKGNDGQIIGKENIAGTTQNFKGNVSELVWEITSEKKKIGKYNCTKAILKNLQHCVVWFTTDLPLMLGPEVYDGLPGMVIETETAFDQTSIESFRYTNDSSEILSKRKVYMNNIKNKKLTPISKVFNAKNNMITMILNEASVK